MSSIGKQDEHLLVLEDSATSKRVANAILAVAGLLLLYSELTRNVADALVLLVGLFLLGLGVYNVCTQASSVFTFNKSKAVLQIRSRHLLRSEGAVREYPLADALAVVSEWSIDPHLGSGWQLTLEMKHDKDGILLNEYSAPTFLFSGVPKRNLQTGESIAAFLGVPFRDKKRFEN